MYAPAGDDTGELVQGGEGVYADARAAPLPALAAADHVYGNVAGHPAKMGTLVGPGSGCAAMYDDQILEPGSDDDYETIDEVTAAALEPTLDDVYDDPSALGEPPAQESVYADARA